jgi:hypothetical protein
MPRALVTRGVLIRGRACAEGEVVDVSAQELAELRSWNYAVAAPEPEPAAAPADDPRAATRHNLVLTPPAEVVAAERKGNGKP